MNHTLKLVSLLLLYIFTGCNNDVERSLTLYEQGKYYEEQQQLDSATYFYRESLNLLKNKNESQKIGEIYNRLGNIFLQTDLYEKAYESYNEAERYNSLLTDKTNLSKSIRGMGLSFAYRYMPDSALNYFLKAFELSDFVNDTTEILLINNNLSNIYCELGQYEKALYYNNIVLTLSKDSINLCRSWLTKASIHLEYQQYDSAWYYYELGAHSNNIYTKAACYSALSELSQILQLPDSSKYLKLFSILNDSIDRCSQSVQVQSSDQNYLMAQTINKHKYSFVYVLAIFFLLCAVIVMFLVYYHKRKLRIERQKKDEEVQGYKNTIQELYIEMKTLQQEIDSIKDCEKNLSESTQKYERLKEIEDNIIANINNVAINCSTNFMRSHEYKQIKEKLRGTCVELTKKERENIYSTVMKAFEPLTQYLSTFMNMATDDCFLCCLALLGFTSKDCAVLRCVTWNAIRSQKNRIKTKFIEVFHTLELYDSIFK